MIKNKLIILLVIFLLYNCENSSKNNNIRYKSEKSDQQVNNEKNKDSLNDKDWNMISKLNQDDHSRVKYLIIDEKNYNFDSLGNFVSLKGIDISGLDLANFPKQILLFNELEVIIAYRNKFKEIPYGLCELINIRKLNFDSNNINYLPSCLDNFTNLKTFLINNNSIEELPQSIGFLANLEIFELVDNNIESLPSNFYKLLELKHCNLQGNNLEYLSSEIGDLTNLEYLDVSNNKIKYLPNEVKSLENLKTLRISNNILSEELINDLKKNMPKVKIR